MTPLCILLCLISSVSAIPDDSLELQEQTVALGDVNTDQYVYGDDIESTDYSGTIAELDYPPADVKLDNGCILQGGVTLSCGSSSGPNEMTPPTQVRPNPPTKPRVVPPAPAKPKAKRHCKFVTHDNIKYEGYCNPKIDQDCPDGEVNINVQNICSEDGRTLCCVKQMHCDPPYNTDLCLEKNRPCANKIKTGQFESGGYGFHCIDPLACCLLNSVENGLEIMPKPKKSPPGPNDTF